MAFIGETVFFRPVPMDLVRIAEQHRIVMLAEVEQKLQLIIGDITEHGNPGGIDLFVRQRLLCQTADTVAKLRCRDGTKLDLHKKILLLIVVDYLLAYICNTQTFECLDTSITGEVDNHTAKIYNQIFYAFHDLLLIENFDSNNLLPTTATSAMSLLLFILTYPAIYQPDK